MPRPPNGQLQSRYADNRDSFGSEQEKQAAKRIEAPKPASDALTVERDAASAKTPAAMPSAPLASSPASSSTPIGGEKLERSADVADSAPREESKSLAQRVQAEDTNLLVVEVQVSPEAARRGDFQRLFAECDRLLRHRRRRY